MLRQLYPYCLVNAPLIISILLIGGCATFMEAPEKDLPASTFDNIEVYARTIDTVVLIQAGDSSGTGFLIAPHLIVSNKHVVTDHDRVDVYFPMHSRRLNDYVKDRRFYEEYKDALEIIGFHYRGRVIAEDEELDLALIMINSELIDLDGIGERFGTCKVDQDVHIIGNPVGYVQNTEGYLESWGLWRWTGGKIVHCGEEEFIIEGNLFHGNSGGPVFDDKGRVIGVVTRSDLQMTAIAIQIDQVGDMFDGLLRLTEQGEQIIEVVSFKNTTSFPINYQFKCNENDSYTAETLGIDQTQIHWCYSDSFLGIDIFPIVRFDYDLSEERMFLEKRLESNWKFAVVESFAIDVDYRNDPRKYYFEHNPQEDRIDLIKET